MMLIFISLFFCSGALSLLYLSVYEGFGLPVMEAIYTGTPIISMNISVIHEFAKDVSSMICYFVNANSRNHIFIP